MDIGEELLFINTTGGVTVQIEVKEYNKVAVEDYVLRWIVLLLLLLMNTNENIIIILNSEEGEEGRRRKVNYLDWFFGYKRDLSHISHFGFG